MRLTSPRGGSDVDLWHHYGRKRAEEDRAVPDDFFWEWGQRTGPGAEALGELRGRVVGDLGAGAARHAAHLVSRYEARSVVAVDPSPAQHGFALRLYGYLAPRLRIVRAPAEEHLRGTPGGYDVLYSVFGALCFADPRRLLPLAAAALRPGGRLVFSTLAEHVGGTPAHADAVPSDIPARTPGGAPATLRRWVLRADVWAELLDEAGFTGVSVDVLPGTLLVACTRAG